MFNRFKKISSKFPETAQVSRFPHIMNWRISRNFVMVALIIIMGLTVVLPQAQPVYAAGIVVNSNADTTGTAICTLRDAIKSANNNAAVPGSTCTSGSGTDTITFASGLSGQTIILTSALPVISSSLTIDGSSLASHVKISGNNLYRVFNIGSATVTLTHLDIINGTPSGDGGGVANSGTLTINNSTLSGNTGGSGGAIVNYATLVVNNSTLSNNTADGGAGIVNHTSLTVNNSTFSNNSATFFGGGLSNLGGTVTVNNSTFSGNAASVNGGGVYNQMVGTVNLNNTILANSPSGSDCYKINGTINIVSSLIETNAAGANSCGTPTLAVDPMLGALANNGGRTQTMALSAGSPAINVGNATVCANAPINNLDQRGVARPQGAQCDMGAYEYPFPGYASNPAIASTINVGSAKVGSSITTSLQISETGAITLTVSSATLGGANAVEFSVSPTSFAIGDGGAARNLVITCTPSVLGLRVATLTVNHNATGSPATYTLNCTGVPTTAGYASNPAISSTINVGSIVVGSPIATNLQISETGNTTLTVSSSSLGGINAANFSVSPASLSIADGGAAKNLTITCIPSASGLRTATLTVNHNAPGSPATYTLNCTGIAPTPTNTNTPTSTPTSTSTSLPTSTATSTPTSSPTATATPSPTAIDTATMTPTPLPGSTDTPTPTMTVISTETTTPVETATLAPTATATPRVFPTRVPPNGCMPSSDARNRANNPLPVCPPLAPPVFIDSGQALGQGDTEVAEIANLTQDLFPDVLVSNDGRPELLINNGSGGFFVDDPIPSLPDPDPSPGFGSSLELADIDADGDVDVVTARPEGNQVWLNDGTGNFSMSNQTIGSGNSSAIALGDIDQDNDMDVVIGTPDNQPATIWLNDGTGKFSDSGQVLNSGDTQAISLGDIDNDNDLDIITVGNTTDTIWLQDGTGKFSASDQVLNSGNSQAISLGDLDNDNDLDIITVGNMTDTVWLQDGTGIFTDTGQVLNSGNSQAISLGDLDMDGDYDAVTVNGETGGAWLNDGTGIFTNQGQTIGNGDTQAISLGDLDMDGDLDIYEGTGSDNPRDRQRQTSQPMPDHIWQNLSPQLKMIGAEGVKIKDVAKQYTTQVTVLSNSLTTTVQFVYTPLVTPTHAYSQLIFAGEGRAFNLSAWQNGQAIANPFVAPISVTMQYDARLARPKLYAWQAQTGQWVEATTGCSPASAYQWSNDTVTMSVCQLTDFALFTTFPKVYLPIVVKTK